MLRSDVMMLSLSLITNCAITFAVAVLMLRGALPADQAFGPDTPARRILACVYVAIGIVSLYALAQLIFGRSDIAVGLAMTLLPLQIIYKLMTAVAVGVRHPVVLTNLAVVALHTATMLTLI